MKYNKDLVEVPNTGNICIMKMVMPFLLKGNKMLSSMRHPNLHKHISEIKVQMFIA